MTLNRQTIADGIRDAAIELTEEKGIDDYMTGIAAGCLIFPVTGEDGELWSDDKLLYMAHPDHRHELEGFVLDWVEAGFRSEEDEQIAIFTCKKIADTFRRCVQVLTICPAE